MAKHDVLLGSRLGVFTPADELGNGFGRLPRDGRRSLDPRPPLKANVDRWAGGAQCSCAGARGAHQIAPHLEGRIVAFSLAHPVYGPRRIGAELAREKSGGIRISEHGVWRVLLV